jgi:F-type H+-transporting ATPase subunit delta
MRASEAASAYARALYDLASLADAVDATDEGLTTAAKAVRGSVDLRAALTDTSVPVEKKRDVLRDIFGAHTTPEVLAVVTLLVERGLAGSLTDVARAFRELAEVTTAVPLDDALRGQIAARLEASLGRPVVLRESIDRSILAGIRISVAGRVLDGSVASQLEGVRRALNSQGGAV